MPTIDFIGKSAVINHHYDIPFKVLNTKYSFNPRAIPAASRYDNNMIIQGDNLEALKSLLLKYQGKIDSVYIDPPYNTGNSSWVYSDNVNNPQLNAWLGKVVGKEGEDLSRHDKWLCMMFPRLRLIQKLLSEDGVVVISIGPTEVNNLISMCKEIFSSRNINLVTVQTNGGKPSAGFNALNEYLVFITSANFKPNSLKRWGGKKRSPYEGMTLSTFTNKERPNQVYPIFVDDDTHAIVGVGKSLRKLMDSGGYVGDPDEFQHDYSVAPKGTTAVYPVTTKFQDCIWRLKPDRLMNDWEKGYIRITPNAAYKTKGHPNKYSVQYLPGGVIQKIEKGQLEIVGTEEGVPTLIFGKNTTEGSAIPTVWTEKDFYTVKGTSELSEIFAEQGKVFDYPKPVELVKTVLDAISGPDSIILDSFAGSGTTGQATLELNSEDDGHRQFILIEMEEYANTITAERIKRVINGYRGHPPIDGSFDFICLGERLLREGGLINTSVDRKLLREYVWYTETQKPYQPQSSDNTYYLGRLSGTDIYFCYEPNSATTLDLEWLRSVSLKADSYIIYADSCALSREFLNKHNIVFKKIPRDIARV